MKKRQYRPLSIVHLLYPFFCVFLFFTGANWYKNLAIGLLFGQSLAAQGAYAFSLWMTMIRITISFIAIAIFIARRKVLEFFSISFSLEAMPMLIGIFAAIFFTILTIVIQRIIEMSQSNRTLTYGLDEIGGNRPTWIEKWVDIHLMRVEEKPKPLLKAVKEGKTAEVHHLLREGYSADASNVEETPLMLAAEGGAHRRNPNSNFQWS